MHHTVVIGIFMNTLICVCNNVFVEWVSDNLFGFVESIKTIRLTEMLKNRMWHFECWGWGGDTLYLSYKRIDKFLFSILKSTQMGMELQKMSTGHGKCYNGTETDPKRIQFMISYVNNWQCCWVRRLLWTEQVCLLGVSYRRWGKGRMLSLYTVFTQI